ncbi:hypothetical protein [Paenibacillus herberti]|uniref:Uncharacterized protein n=1 Tax=Paenibacillus herberti TaxID=1619309 RepID=A0A229NWM5_9BACL|nr:hypothetical protein [Paenibacillus herberti]OXM14145.1 hypothetical protein CGZ75_14315 [Paenibacillus herberti]
MKKRHWKWSVGALVLATGVWTGTQWDTIANSLGGQASAAEATNAPSSVPGTVDDPVVTKSYVDQKIAELKNGGGGTGSTPAATATPKPSTAPSTAPSPGDSPEPADSGIKVINVPIGKTLIAADGAEVVVRGGKAVAYSPDSNGIADVTAGVDIKSGSSVPQNHLILFPRGGRGVGSAEGMKSGLTVMVRGEYEIKTIEKSK